MKFDPFVSRVLMRVLIAGCMICAPAEAATIGINFARDNGGATTGTADGFTAWTDVYDSDGFPGTKTVTGSSVSASWLASNSWYAGSNSDSERRIYACYIDDGQSSPTATFGGTSSDGIGVRVKITGLSAWLAANANTSYQIRAYASTDTTAGTFQTVTIHDGTATGTTLGTIARPVLGDGTFPTGSNYTTSTPRGYGDSVSTLTADTITLTIPKRSGNLRGTLAALKITGVGSSPPIDVFNQVGATSFVNAALAAGKTSVFRAGTDVATVTGSFSVTATHTIQVIAPTGGFVVQQYPLINFPVATSPAITVGLFQLLDLPRGITANLVVNTSGNPYTLALNVTAVGAAQPLYWTGSTTGGVWDIKNTANWSYAAAPSQYWEGDQVVFDASASGTTDVVLNTAVLPGSVSVAGTIPYSITGSGSIGGTCGLTKTGSGTLTVTTSNSYSGPTLVSGGTLILGSNTALGSTSGSGASVTNGAAINLNGTDVAQGTVNLIGTGPDGAGVLVNNSTTAASLTAAVALTGGTTLGGSGDTVLSGSITGAGKNLVKAGAGTMTCSTSPSVTGTLTVNQGTWVANSAHNLQAFSSTTINDTATIRWTADNFLFGSGPSASNLLTLNQGGVLTTTSCSCHLGPMAMNGGTIHADTANTSWANYNLDFPLTTSGSGRTSSITGGNITVSQSGGTVFTIGAGDTLVISSTIDGTTLAADNGLIKQGPGTLLLAADNTYFSPTTVNAGTLTVDGSADYSASLTVGATGTVSGTGSMWYVPATINGTVAPGDAADPLGLLVLGSTTLNGTLAVTLDPTLSNTLAVYGNLTLGATAAITLTGTPTATSYQIAVYSGTLSGTIATSPPAGYHFAYDTAGKQILLESDAAGFDAWIRNSGVAITDRDLSADPDNDGIPNGIEYILGGNPASAANAPTLPQALHSGGSFVFSFDRVVTSETPDVALSFQYSANLMDWTDIPLDAANPPTVTITRSTDGLTDHIAVTLPAYSATTPKLYGRLKVTSTTP